LKLEGQLKLIIKAYADDLKFTLNIMREVEYAIRKLERLWHALQLNKAKCAIMFIGYHQTEVLEVRGIPIVQSYSNLGINFAKNTREVRDSIIKQLKAQTTVKAKRFKDVIPCHRIKMFTCFIIARLSY
jgi:F0F1-type ATP synthase gamma subunit